MLTLGGEEEVYIFRGFAIMNDLIFNYNEKRLMLALAKFIPQFSWQEM